jgi:hypothetical protein
MAFPEVSVYEVREVLCLRVMRRGIRESGRLAALDPKTVRRYVAAGAAAGLSVGDDLAAVTDAVVAHLVAAARPARPARHRATWALCFAHREFIAAGLGGTCRSSRDAHGGTPPCLRARDQGAEADPPCQSAAAYRSRRSPT